MRRFALNIVLVIAFAAILATAVAACTRFAPQPTPDIQATVEAAVAKALPTATPTPTPNIDATVAAAIGATVAAAQTLIVEPDPRYDQGRTLWMRAEKPIIQAAVQYVGLDTAGRQHNWAIDPVNSGTEIAVVEVTIINATSDLTRLVVDRDAAELLLRDVDEGVKPVNVIDRAVPTNFYDPKLDFAGFLPIWGSLTLYSNEQIHGHMVFEVPEGATPLKFRWLASDAMSVRY